MWRAVSALHVREDAHRAEFRAAAAAKLVRRQLRELVEMSHERLPEEGGRLVVVELGPSLGLRDDPVDHAQL